MLAAPRPRAGATRPVEYRPPPFAPIVLAVRWATLAVGLALAPGQGTGARAALGWGLLLLAYNAWRTGHRLDLDRPRAGLGVAARTAPFVVDVGVVALAVVSTGYWSSPYAFCLLTGLVAAGFAHGVGFAVRLGAAVSVSVTVPELLAAGPATGSELRSAGQWVAELLLVALLAGHARRVFGDGQLLHSAALDRVSQLAEANDLLVSLHRVAQTLPASLNLDQVLASTVARLRSVVASDVTAVLLRDDADRGWVVAAAEGTSAGRTIADADLPPPLAAATTSSVASLVVCLAPGEGLGPEFLSHSGLYAPLRARGRLVGLLAVEHHAPGHYGRRELQILDGFVETAALGIDNARWFSRLRAIGADEERVRIARDMHDRVGQSLAGVGFALDRLRNRTDDETARAELDRLRDLVRGALGEVRETLADLRAGVADGQGLAAALEAFLQRVAERSPLAVTLQANEIQRLPLVQERELWRVAQEAVTNAERHARAERLSVRWYCDGRHAALTVADDGRGFDRSAPPPPDCYGITGMRERAEGIGAALRLDSAPGSGTMVTCVLGTPPKP